MKTLKEFGTGSGWVADNSVGLHVGLGSDSSIDPVIFTDDNLLVFESREEAQEFINSKARGRPYHPVEHSWGDEHPCDSDSDRLDEIDNAVAHGALDNPPANVEEYRSDMQWLIDEVKRQRKLRDDAYDWAQKANKARDGAEAMRGEAEAQLTVMLLEMKGNEQATDQFFRQRNEKHKEVEELKSELEEQGDKMEGLKESIRLAHQFAKDCKPVMSREALKNAMFDMGEL